MQSIKIKQILFYVLLTIPFFSFSDYSIDNLIYRNLKFLLRFILLFFLLINWRHISLFKIKPLSSFNFYLVYLFFALLSLFFSSDLIYSSIKFFEVVLMLLTSIYIVNKFSTDLNSIVKITAVIIIIYLVLFLTLGFTIYPSFYRSMGNSGTLRLGGGLINPNLLAYCLLIIFFSIDFLKAKYLFRVLFKIIVLYLIFMTYSRSAIVIFFGMTLYKFLKNTPLLVNVFLALIFLFSIFYFDIIDSMIFLLQRGNDLNNVFTFGGRIPVWIELIENYSFGIHNFFGFGFQCLSENGLGVSIESWGDYSELTMAHNNILQVLYGMGFFGLLISIYVFIALYKEINKILDINIRLYFKRMFYILMFFCLVEFGVYGPTNILILIFSIYLFAFQKYGRH